MSQTQLDPHETHKIFETLSPTRLFFRCALPNIASMAMVALYTIADGIFVGRFIGAEALAAINLAMPPMTICFAITDMIGIGSSVQIAIRLGEKKIEEASRLFSFCTLFLILISCLIGIIGFFGAKPAIALMGADPVVTELAAEYIKVFAVFSPFILVYFAIDNYLRICGRPHFSMMINVSMALLNMVLDFIFLAIFDWGIWAAALASCVGFFLGSIMGYLPFIMKKTPLYFTSIKIKIRTLIAIIYNGSSEFFSNIAGSILMIILNTILLRISGSMAVAAFSVVMYIDSIVVSIMYGITDSMQPPISYCYGARLRKRMYSMEKRALAAGAVISAVTFICMRCFGDTITSLFIKGSNPELMNLSLQAIELFSLTYIAMWIPFILSAFFTAVNKPGLSLGISMCRSLLFPLAAVPLLVHFLGVDGVWLTASVSSTLSAIVSVFFLIKFVRKERTSNPENGE